MSLLYINLILNKLVTYWHSYCDLSIDIFYCSFVSSRTCILFPNSMHSSTYINGVYMSSAWIYSWQALAGSRNVHYLKIPDFICSFEMFLYCYYQVYLELRLELIISSLLAAQTFFCFLIRHIKAGNICEKASDRSVDKHKNEPQVPKLECTNEAIRSVKSNCRM